MKKTFRFLFLLSMMLISINVNAQDCSQIADLLTRSVSHVTDQIKESKDISDFHNIRVDDALTNVDVSDIPVNCLFSRISNSDKSKIKTTFNNLFDVLAEKTYEFTNGAMSMDAINKQFTPMKSTINDIIDQSDTYQDLTESLKMLR